MISIISWYELSAEFWVIFESTANFFTLFNYFVLLINFSCVATHSKEILLLLILLVSFNEFVKVLLIIVVFILYALIIKRLQATYCNLLSLVLSFK